MFKKRGGWKGIPLCIAGSWVSNGSFPRFIFLLLQLQTTLMLEMTDRLAQILVCEHGRHGGRDGPEQVGTDSRVETAPALFLEDCLKRAYHAVVA